MQKAADWAASTQIQRVLMYLKVVGFVKADMSVIHSNFKLHEIAPETNGKAMGCRRSRSLLVASRQSTHETPS